MRQASDSPFIGTRTPYLCRGCLHGRLLGCCSGLLCLALLRPCCCRMHGAFLSVLASRCVCCTCRCCCAVCIIIISCGCVTLSSFS